MAQAAQHLPATQEKPKTKAQEANALIVANLDRRTNQLRTLLPKDSDVQKFKQTALLAVAQNPALRGCDLTSLILSFLYCAKRGLEPGQPDGVALVPYKGKVQPIVQFRGLIKLATEHGAVDRVDAYVVYENDTFDYYIDNGVEKLLHRPVALNKPRGEVFGAYAVFFLPGQTMPKYEVMRLEDINKVRDSSPAAKDGPWVKWEDEMRKKTAIRRGFKTIPLAAKVRDAIEDDTKLEMGVGVEDVLDGLALEDGAGDGGPPQSQAAAIAADLAAKIGDGAAPPPGDLPPPPAAEAPPPVVAPLAPKEPEVLTNPVPPPKKLSPAQAAELKRAMNQLADLQAAYNAPWEVITREHGIKSWEEIKTLEQAQAVKATIMTFNPER